MAGFRRFERQTDGRLVLTLFGTERELIDSLALQVRTVLESAEDDDPISQRLFPRAYSDPTEDVAEQQWQAMVHGDLAAERIAAIDAVRAVLAAGEVTADTDDEREPVVQVVLDEEQASNLLRAVNDIRLALGAALGVTAADDLDDEERAGSVAWELYDWFTALESRFVDTLLESMPE